MRREPEAAFKSRHQVDLAYSVPGLARFRVNLFRQRGSVSAVLRIITSDEAALQVVNLSQETIEFFRDQEKGLVLVTGATGSGKSTTLARIVDEINRVHAKMIVTVEDPIEYLHKSKRSAVVQRELGVDARSFSEALIAAMRQDPDIIMIGEIRDHATAAAALSAAQTGHLVFSTLHTQDSVRTINRMIELFPPHERSTARILFAESLVGIVSQRLLPRRDGGGRVAAMEILKGTLRIKDLVRDEERTGELYDALQGCQARRHAAVRRPSGRALCRRRHQLRDRHGRGDQRPGVQDGGHPGRRATPRRRQSERRLSARPRRLRTAPRAAAGAPAGSHRSEDGSRAAHGDPR